jgi:primosomal protein N' (replication factor Y)
MVDTPLPQLDKPLDYLVPEKLSEAALVGSLVKVKLHGRRMDGWLVAREATTTFQGKLAEVEKVVSAVPPLSAETIEIVRKVADENLGTFADVARAAAPPRHARAEAHALANPLKPGKWRLVADGGLAEVSGGLALRRRIAQGVTPPPWAVWQPTPANPWAHDIAALVSDAQHANKGALVVVPDEKDVQQVATALTQSQIRHVTLSAQATAEARYAAFMALRLGQVNVCVGTRNAIFAPVQQLGLIVAFGDDDENLVSPIAPYWQVGDVAILRAKKSNAALVLGGWVNSLRAQQLIDSKQALQVSCMKARKRANVARVNVVGTEGESKIDKAATFARLPYGAWRAIKGGLARGPVLVHVAQLGDAPLGTDTTAAQFRKAFPGVAVVVASAKRPIREVPDRPGIVIATSGAEPPAKRGYQAAVILDGRTELSRPFLNARMAAAMRWFQIASLVKPEAVGGVVGLVAPSDSTVTQALVRWSPSTVAESELIERARLKMPPAYWGALLRAESEQAITTFIDELGVACLARSDNDLTYDVLGPNDLEINNQKVKKGRGWSALLTTTQAQRSKLQSCLNQVVVSRAGKSLPVVSLQVNPLSID